MFCENRKARHNYHLDERFEAGLSLMGTEAQAIRDGRVSIGEAYIVEQNDGLYLKDAHIGECKNAMRGTAHEPYRLRKLLLHKKEIATLIGAMSQNGKTVVPTKMYANDRGKIKLEIAIARGKQNHDKRESIKERDWKRQQARILKN